MGLAQRWQKAVPERFRKIRVSDFLCLRMANSSFTTCSQEVEEGYTIIKTLGGKFSVREVQQKGTRKRFAWKQVQLDKDPCCDLQIQLLRRVQHKNIVRLYDVYWAAGVMDIMLELCAGTMAECIGSYRDTSGTYHTPGRMQVAKSLSQLLMAVNFLHENQALVRIWDFFWVVFLLAPNQSLTNPHFTRFWEQDHTAWIYVEYLLLRLMIFYFVFAGWLYDSLQHILAYILCIYFWFSVCYNYKFLLIKTLNMVILRYLLS